VQASKLRSAGDWRTGVVWSDDRRLRYGAAVDADSTEHDDLIDGSRPLIARTAHQERQMRMFGPCVASHEHAATLSRYEHQRRDPLRRMGGRPRGWARSNGTGDVPATGGL